MKYYSRCLPMVLLMLFLLPTFAFGQNEEAEVDSTFEKYMSNAWDKLDEADMSDSLQNIYSDEFYEYYTQNPDTETGKEALSQAFLMWGNTGNDAHLEEALETLDYDSEIWSRIITSLGNIYVRSEKREREDYEELLVDLSDKITNPVGKSEALLSLLRMSSKMEEKKEAAIDYARRLVELEASEFHTEQGLGYLHELESLNIGQEAPEFEARTISGEEITLSELEGQFVLLEFWATWCGPCLPEIPHLKTLREKHRDANFKIVGISIDREREALMEFIEEREIDWTQVYEEDSWKSEILRQYNVSGIPRMYVIDPDGRIAAKDIRGEEMVAEIDNLISEYSE